ncbi:hypothetical protein K523DRAFT_257501 [Schizophyllum commune Tattone D]|nr:hypothetical protein K523DRAFT_257501 [Schizophyllum commune Tattone D]
MVADFVSMDHGWLRSLDGERSARVYFHAGKNRDGWFDNEDVLKQAHCAMDILNASYPDEEHVLIYDNATTHRKRPVGALTASGMTKGPSANFFVQTAMLDDEGRPVYDSTGKRAKEKTTKMRDTVWEGKTQTLYFADMPSSDASAEEIEHKGKFKGMRRLLEERGLYMEGMKAQCNAKKWGACPQDGKDGKINCCCRRTLYNQPDFQNVPSALEVEAEQRGFRVLFLPKYHCELNPIEMCWGYCKRIYRVLPFSKELDQLERNVRACLEEVPLVTIRRFFNRTMRFLDAYSKGLDGEAADWAVKKFRSHRTVSESIMAMWDVEKEQRRLKKSSRTRR